MDINAPFERVLIEKHIPFFLFQKFVISISYNEHQLLNMSHLTELTLRCFGNLSLRVIVKDLQIWALLWKQHGKEIQYLPDMKVYTTIIFFFWGQYWLIQEVKLIQVNP